MWVFSEQDAQEEAREGVPQLSNWINNEFVTPASKKCLDVTTPITGSVLAKVPMSDADDVAQAVEAAHSAFQQWSARTYKDRAQFLIKLHRVLTDHADELADLVVIEHGKTKPEALGSVMKGAETLEYAM